MKLMMWTVIAGLVLANSAVADLVSAPPAGVDPPGLDRRPVSFVQIGDRTLPSPAVEQNGDLFRWLFEESNDEYELTIEVNADADPFISYSANAINFTGAPLAFSFVFSIPIVETPSPSTVFSSLSGGITDATGNGVSITPIFGTVQRSFGNDDNTGLVNLGVDTGAAGFAAGIGSHLYGPFNAGPQAGPPHAATGWDYLEVRVDFRLSGNNDAVGLTGFTSIETVIPLPAAAWLAMPLMAALGLRRNRR